MTIAPMARFVSANSNITRRSRGRSAAAGEFINPLPPAVWRVTEQNPSADFTWVSRAPGVHVLARHTAEKAAIGTRVALSVSNGGLVGRPLGQWLTT